MTAFSPFHSPQQPVQETVAIVGAGIIGSCIAHQLQNAGYKVTIIDNKGVAQGCSKGNAGHFATEQVFPLADFSLLPQLPKMLLDPLGPFRIKMSYLAKALPWFARFVANMRGKKYSAHTKALRALNERSMSAFDEIFEATNTQGLVVKKGSLLTFENTGLTTAVKIQQHYQSQGVEVALLSRAKTLELEPNLSSKVTASLLFKDVGHTINPEFLCQSIFKASLEDGAGFIKGEVVKIIPNQQKVEIKLKSQSMRFDKVILAGGVHSKSLLTSLGYRVPIEAERGYHLMLDNQQMLSRPVASYERKFIMTPMREGLRLAGTVEFAGIKAPMNSKRSKILKPHAKALLNAELSEKDKPTWMGNRPSFPDSLPVICQTEKYPNLFLAFGHQHLGLTQAGITAKLIKQLVSNQPTDIDMSPYRIERFN